MTPKTITTAARKGYDYSYGYGYHWREPMPAYETKYNEITPKKYHEKDAMPKTTTNFFTPSKDTKEYLYQHISTQL